LHHHCGLLSLKAEAIVAYIVSREHSVTASQRWTARDAARHRVFGWRVFGQGEKARVDQDVLKWVEQKADPEARRNIENAGAAGVATSEPNRAGGWKKAFAR
jgi:hypothetical protein